MITFYFMVPQLDLKQRHLNLSVNPDVSATMLPTCQMGQTLCYVLEAIPENRFNDAFLDFKGYTADECLMQMSVQGVSAGASVGVSLLVIDPQPADVAPPKSLFSFFS